MAIDSGNFINPNKSCENLLNQIAIEKYNITMDSVNENSLTPFDRYLKNKDRKISEFKNKVR